MTGTVIVMQWQWVTTIMMEVMMVAATSLWLQESYNGSVKE